MPNKIQRYVNRRHGAWEAAIHDLLVGLTNDITGVFGIVFVTVFRQILNFFFFVKIECGLYFLNRFDVLMSKMIFKK